MLVNLNAFPPKVPVQEELATVSISIALTWLIQTLAYICKPLKSISLSGENSTVRYTQDPPQRGHHSELNAIIKLTAIQLTINMNFLTSNVNC